MADEIQELTPEQRAELPPDHPMQDKTIDLSGDPAAHTHSWVSRGAGEGGSHTLYCTGCGATGSGFGEFPAETPAGS